MAMTNIFIGRQWYSLGKWVISNETEPDGLGIAIKRFRGEVKESV
jgi:hypothetical protein